jgi:hypothetical protein
MVVGGLESRVPWLCLNRTSATLAMSPWESCRSPPCFSSGEVLGTKQAPLAPLRAKWSRADEALSA